jgi:hypothetical protein
MRPARRPAEPWDVDKAAELAAEALAYLARHYPECSGSEALGPYEDAAHDAAMDADKEEVQGGPEGLHEGRQGRGPQDTTGCGMSVTESNTVPSY